MAAAAAAEEKKILFLMPRTLCVDEFQISISERAQI